jgi:hypothetical protein
MAHQYEKTKKLLSCLVQEEEKKKKSSTLAAVSDEVWLDLVGFLSLGRGPGLRGGRGVEKFAIVEDISGSKTTKSCSKVSLICADFEFRNWTAGK